jgi:hypothetical protein
LSSTTASPGLSLCKCAPPSTTLLPVLLVLFCLCFPPCPYLLCVPPFGSLSQQHVHLHCGHLSLQVWLVCSGMFFFFSLFILPRSLSVFRDHRNLPLAFALL